MSGDDAEAGAWVVYFWDWDVYVLSIHETEPEARRAVDDPTFWSVAFVPFGTDVTEACR